MLYEENSRITRFPIRERTRKVLIRVIWESTVH